MKILTHRLFALTLLLSAHAGAAPPAAEWIERSNAHARILIEGFARFNPEQVGQFGGLDAVDREVVDLKPGVFERQQASLRESLANVDAALASEQDPRVRQDLEIMREQVRRAIEGNELNQRLLLPYFDAPQVVFLGMRALLDDQVAPERRAAALVRLRKYAGVEPGTTPILKLAEERLRERLPVPGLLGPAKTELETDLGNTDEFIDGVAELLQKYKLAGWQPAHARLKEQAATYRAFVEREIAPRARTDFRLPRELYAFGLKAWT